MRVLLVCKGEYRYSFPAIARTLKSEHGCDVRAITFTTPATRVMEASGAFSEVYNVAAHLKEFTQNHDVEECIESLQDTPFAEHLNTMV